MSSKAFSKVFFAWSLIAISGCVPQPILPPTLAGPIDGTWVQVSGTCNGSAESGANGVLMVADLAGEYDQALNDGCTISTPVTFTYPSTGTTTVLTGTRQCGSSCSGSDQTSSGCGTSSQTSPWNADYTVVGNTMTLTITNSGCSKPGNSNDVGTDTEVDTFTQQPQPPQG